MLRVVIIDDEFHGLEALKQSIADHCPDVEVMGAYQDPISGVEAVKKNPPDALFLDIDMTTLNGFEVLKKLEPIDCSVIFTTAHEHYALKAFEVDAIDYLLKPIAEEDLMDAIEKCRDHQKILEAGKLEEILEKLIHVQDLQVISVPSQKGMDFYEPREIIYCKSDSNYTIFYLTDQRKQIIAKTLKEVNKMLPDHLFMRIHQSYIVNLSHIKSYLKEDGGYVVMSNTDKVRIARHQKDDLLERLMDSQD